MIKKGNFGLDSPNVVDEMLKVEGDLTQAEASEMVARLLASKPGLLYNMLTGGESLFSFQIAKMAVLAKRDFTLDVSARGGAKTFTTAVFALIYAITHPGIKILVLGPTLRQAKTLLNYIMDISKKPNAFLLRQFLTEKNYKKDPDRYSIKIGTGIFGPESEIFAMALGDGKKIRGARAQVIILDEAFAIPQNIIDEVIGPMMIVNANISERVKTKELEDKLVASGKMKDSERRRFPNNKMIMLSSACYEFESFYRRFESYRDKILNPNIDRDEGEITYGIVNLGWEAHPTELLSKTFVLREQESMSEDSFRREYEAQFSPDSASYFKMSVMSKRTLLPGEYPHIEIKGDDPSRYFYVLGVDPNFSNSETSDNYAMALLKVERGKENKGTLVHNYAVAGLEADNTIRYVIYLLTHFNIEYVCMDFAGARQSLDTWNNSSLFKERNLKLEDFEAKFDSEKDVRNSKYSYDLGSRKIVHIQNFNTGWIREANEYMQMCFDRGKLFFASRPIDSEFESMVRRRNIPIDQINYLYGQENEDNFNEEDWLKKKQYDFIEHQVRLISQSKTECANVKMTASPQGHQTFDLPSTMRKMNTPDKPRKDSYSALLLANWGRKCYQLLNETDEEQLSTWVPPMMF
jgi:hypothetical protein